MKRFVLLAPLALFAACNEPKAGEPVVTVALKDEDGSDAEPLPATGPLVPVPENRSASACAPATFEQVDLTVCVADPDEHSISVVYGPDSSTAYGNLSAFADTVEASTIAFAMNGGAFSDDLSSKGYLVSEGNRISELDRGSGDGNFYMKPNGVFFGTGARWRILTTDRFFSTVRDRPRFGTQSGPILLVDDELGGAISENGNSRTVRNAVGIDANGHAHFVISSGPISYGQLARYMRDQLEVTDALFLDANSSSLWDPPTGRMDQGRTGPILVVTKKAAS